VSLSSASAPRWTKCAVDRPTMSVFVIMPVSSPACENVMCRKFCHTTKSNVGETIQSGSISEQKDLPVCGTCSQRALMEPPFVSAWCPPTAVTGPQSRRRADHEICRCASPIHSQRGEALQTELVSQSRTSRYANEPIKLLSFSRATYPRNVPFSTTGKPWYSHVSANLSVLLFVSGVSSQ
jgi:hypothetical protein